MDYRRLGTTGLQLSDIGLGSWLTYGYTVDAAASEKIVHRAYEAGVNFFDTADVYNLGEAEKSLGAALSSVKRTDVVIATKCFFPISEDMNDHGLSRKHIVESVHRSLGNLQTEYIDLFQCHRYDDATPLAETVRAFDDLIRQGKILYWGVSQWSAPQITEAVMLARANGWAEPVSNQPIYNIINRSLEVEVMKTCQHFGLGIVVFSPLAQGILSGKYTGGKIPEGSRAANQKTAPFMQKNLTNEMLARVDRLRAVAQAENLTLSQLALAWCLRRSQVTSVITGATTMAQLEENLGATAKKLSKETVAAIDEIIPTYPVDQYTGGRL